MPTAPRMLLERQEEFREAVKKSRGRVVVLVHPYYLTKSEMMLPIYLTPFEQMPPEKASAVSKIYLSVRRKLIQRIKVPIIVLEERHKLKRTHTWLRKINPFYVETITAHPRPVNDWEEMHAALRSAGVHTILVGGIHARSSFYGYNYVAAKRYEESQPNPPTRTLAGGCAGQAYAEFVGSGHGKVRWLPNLAFPERPHERD